MMHQPEPILAAIESLTARTHALAVANDDVRRVAAFLRHKKLDTLTVYDDARRDHAGDVSALVASSW